MKFSLVVVEASRGETVTGNWLQGHIGTLESAIESAQRTEIVNSNKIDVAVVNEVATGSLYHENLKRLDKQRVNPQSGRG